MPRFDTVTTKVFKYDELSPEAQAKARDWYREGNLDYEWWDSIYEDAVKVAECLGISIGTRRDSKEPAIFFSGFCSQGDGACFEGTYCYKKGWRKALEDYAPSRNKIDGEWVPSESNAELHQIGSALQEVQRRYMYQLEATVRHYGHYYHSGCTSIDVTHTESMYRDIGGAEDDVKTQLRLFMDWIYDQLEKEHDYLQADEQIAESIRSNEHEFREDGTHY